MINFNSVNPLKQAGISMQMIKTLQIAASLASAWAEAFVVKAQAEIGCWQYQ